MYLSGDYPRATENKTARTRMPKYGHIDSQTNRLCKSPTTWCGTWVRSMLENMELGGKMKKMPKHNQISLGSN